MDVLGDRDEAGPGLFKQLNRQVDFYHKGPGKFSVYVVWVHDGKVKDTRVEDAHIRHVVTTHRTARNKRELLVDVSHKRRTQTGIVGAQTGRVQRGGG